MDVGVGGRHSSNTIKLKMLCQKYNKNTIQVETADELRPANFKRAKTIGIVGAASTPEYIIDEVKKKLRQLS